MGGGGLFLLGVSETQPRFRRHSSSISPFFSHAVRSRWNSATVYSAFGLYHCFSVDPQAVSRPRTAQHRRKALITRAMIPRGPEGTGPDWWLLLIAEQSPRAALASGDLELTLPREEHH